MENGKEEHEFKSLNNVINSDGNELIGECINAFYKSGIQKLNIELAKRYIEAGGAVILSPNAIRMVYQDEKELQTAVLDRDHYRCYLCGGQASDIETIQTTSEGGIKVLSNMRSVCKHCSRLHLMWRKKIQKTRRRYAINYAIPLYVNKSPEIASVIENPKGRLLEQSRDTTIRIYCDISEYEYTGTFGGAAVVIGKNVPGIQVYTTKFNVGAYRSFLAEMKMVHFALKIGEKLVCNQPIKVYTDVNLYILQHEESAAGEMFRNIQAEINTGIYRNVILRYLHPKIQNYKLYQLAHMYARKARLPDLSE